MNTCAMKKILIVEDDISIRELLVEIFESEGYLVDSRANGSEGLKSLETTIPDVILMDVMMPVMDGFEFRQAQLRNPIWGSIPLLAMSAQDQKQEKLEDYGITNFINKPLELDQLLATVERLSYQ
jgi:CheY-like chemotaxis protein